MGYFSKGAAALLIAGAVLKESAGQPEWFTAYDLNVLFLLFGLVALGQYEWRRREEWRSNELSLVKLAGAAVVTLLLVGVMVRQEGPGIPPARRGLELVAIYLLVLTYPFFHSGVTRLVRRNWPYLAAYGVLWGIYLYHGSTYPAGSGFASFPIAAGFLIVASIFVVPRYVSGEDFLWAAARVTAVVVALGLLAYVVGEYTAVILPVGLWGTTFSPPLLSVRINSLQSVFVNPNDAGLLIFVGTFAALVELRRAYERTQSLPFLLVPGALFLLNGVGVYLSNSRAAMAAAAASAAIYLVYARFGWGALPGAIVAVVVAVVALLAAIAANVLAIDPGGRFVLWSAGVEALSRAPKLFGRGIVASGEVIAPYVTDPDHVGAGVHNSYLTTTIRVGLVGGAAHVVLAVGSVVHAVLADRGVDAAMIALAAGFALHQLFESYTLFQHSMGAVLAAMAVGFVVTRVRHGETGKAETGSQSIADVLGGHDERSPLG